MPEATARWPRLTYMAQSKVPGEGRGESTHCNEDPQTGTTRSKQQQVTLMPIDTLCVWAMERERSVSRPPSSPILPAQ
jgi:hypothetical protein